MEVRSIEAELAVSEQGWDIRGDLDKCLRCVPRHSVDAEAKLKELGLALPMIPAPLGACHTKVWRPWAIDGSFTLITSPNGPTISRVTVKC